jgi:hypothetical protein
MALALRPITLAWLASALVHLGLVAAAWPGAATAPRPSPLRGHSAWSSQAPITAYLVLQAPVSMPGAAVVAKVTAPRPAVAVAPEASKALDAGPAATLPEAPTEPADAGEPVAAPAAARSGWGQGGNTWLAHRSVWQEGARQLALQGQAQTAAAQDQAHRLAARAAHAHYLLTWQQRVGALPLDGSCEVTLAGGDLPDVRCHAASDEAMLIALALELGPVPADAI